MAAFQSTRALARLLNPANLRRSAAFGTAAAGVALYTNGGGVAGCEAAMVAPPEASPSPFEKLSKALTPELRKKMKAEATGTGLIVLIGTGAGMSTMYLASGLPLIAISLIWGKAVGLAIFASRDVSGAHLNPAITAALAAHGKFSWSEVPWYVAAQVGGAAVASAINYGIFRNAIAAFEATKGIVRGTPASTASFNGAFGLSVREFPLLKAPGCFAAEVVATGALSYIVFAVSDKGSSAPADAVPPIVAASVMALVAAFGPACGACMNPARDLGPRLVTLFAGWKGAALCPASILAYSAGPVLGAVLGGALQQFISKQQQQSEEQVQQQVQ